jgi:hypothetical protein
MFSFILFFTVFAQNQIDLANVTSLLFQRGQLATGQHSSLGPQLQCLSTPSAVSPISPVPRGNCDFVEKVLCENKGATGWNDNDTDHWQCVPITPPNVRIKNTHVICEEYNNSDHSNHSVTNIVNGSCFLRFEIDSIESTGSRNQIWIWIGYALFLIILTSLVLACIHYYVIQDQRNDYSSIPDHEVHELAVRETSQARPKFSHFKSSPQLHLEEDSIRIPIENHENHENHEKHENHKNDERHRHKQRQTSRGGTLKDHLLLLTDSCNQKVK